MVFVLVFRSNRVVPDELVTLTSWDARDFLIFLVMVGWKGKDAVKDGVVAFSCLLNCLRISLLGFSTFWFTLSMMNLTLPGGVHFVRRLCRPRISTWTAQKLPNQVEKRKVTLEKLPKSRQGKHKFKFHFFNYTINLNILSTHSLIR